MSLPRTFAWFVLAIIVSFHAGCHLTGELWIAADGSGNGTIVVTHPAEGFDLADGRRQLEKAGFVVTRIAGRSSASDRAGRPASDPTDLDRALDRIPKSLEGFDADIRWDRFEQPFRSRSVERDGSVLLDFGALDPEVTMIVHVPGAIDEGESFGAVTGRRTVTFTHGLAKVRYHPTSVWTCLAAATGSAVAALGVWLLMRARRRAHAPTGTGAGVSRLER